MVDYRITCATQISCSQSRGHVVSVRLDSGSKVHTVAEIYGLMDAGHEFYTSEDGTVSKVRRWKCSYCGQPTLHSRQDASVANSLDSLPSC